MPAEQRVDLEGDRVVQHGTLLQVAGGEADRVEEGGAGSASEDAVADEVPVVEPLRDNRPGYVQATQHLKLLQTNPEVQPRPEDNPSNIRNPNNPPILLKTQIL